MDSALREHEELVKQYFGTIIPQNDNKFAALNSAVWSGGSFIYVPPGVKIEMPLQAYFRINAENMGQFERTLIIVDEGAYVHYVEGCTAPIYSSDSLHSAVVEIIVKPNARCRYTTIQNWSNNVYNLVTKRAVAYENATMEWVDGNLGSKLTMKYPAIWLLGEGAHGEVLSIAFGGKGQHQDAGGKCVHVAPNTTSVITSKSISKDGGRAGYRGLLEVAKGAKNAKSKVVCDALILDEESRSDTYPYIKIDEDEVDIGHEATVSKIGEEQLFYLMSRGLSEAEASAMIVSGFVEPITKELPLEYAVEMNRLIQLQMEGRSVDRSRARRLLTIPTRDPSERGFYHETLGLPLDEQPEELTRAGDDCFWEPENEGSSSARPAASRCACRCRGAGRARAKGVEFVGAGDTGVCKMASARPRRKRSSCTGGTRMSAEALERYSALPVPDTTEEHWRFTDLRLRPDLHRHGAAGGPSRCSSSTWPGSPTSPRPGSRSRGPRRGSASSRSTRRTSGWASSSAGRTTSSPRTTPRPGSTACSCTCRRASSSTGRCTSASPTRSRAARSSGACS